MRKIVILIVILSVLACSVEGAHIQQSIRAGQVPSRGVNLGGWLVLEKWMTSASVAWQGVPDSIANQGEYKTITYLGHAVGDALFEQHRKTWINESDIAEIASRGLNTVRVPVGYWIAGFDKTGGTDWQVFAPGALKYLDLLIKQWALKYNVAVLVSIHAAKGSQNGADHSAPPTYGTTYWSQHPENIQNTIDLATFLADRYKNETAFLGIGLLNEPSGSTDDTKLRDYYLRAYKAIRATGNDCILTHAPLLWEQDPAYYANFTPPSQGYYNCWHEWHKYLIWGYEGQTENQILGAALDGISSQITSWTGNRLFIGEWALATTSSAPFNTSATFLQFASKYFKTVSPAHWTYWSWKCSNDEVGFNAWSLRNLLRLGLTIQ